MVFFSSQVWVWELDHKEGWVPKNWWFWAVILEKTLESPLDGEEIKPVNPKGNQPWIFIHWKDLMQRVNSLEKTLMLGKTEGKRRGWQRMRWSANITNSMGMNLSWLWETVDREAGMTQSMGSLRWNQLSNWMAVTTMVIYWIVFKGLSYDQICIFNC